MGKLHDNLNLVFANLLAGANFPLYVSLTRDYLDFRQLFLWQLMAAGFFFIPYVFFSRRSYRITWRDLRSIVWVTVLVVFGWMFLQVWGATYTNPIDASLMATLGPVLTLVTARFVNHERPSPLRLAGMAGALVGALMLLLDQGRALLSGGEGTGNALILLAVTATAMNTVFVKPQLRHLGTPVVMGWCYLLGLLVAVPLLRGWADPSVLLELPLGALGEVAYVLGPGTVLSMYLLYRGTERLTPVHTALYRYIQPLMASVLALLRGQERLDSVNLAAAGFIVVGAVLVIVGTIRANRQAADRFASASSAAADPPPDAERPVADER